MSFGSGGTGFSFGANANNNQQQSSGFGGFGNNTSTANNTGGFGSGTSGFGSSTTQSNSFGGSTFGSNTGGGFGSNTSNTSTSLFGNKPASTPFGQTAPTSGGLFGNTANTSGGFGSQNTGGAFGATSNNAFGSTNNNNTSAFNFGNTNKPAFGSNAASGSLFGQGGAGTTGGFGSNSAFGSAGSGTALNQAVPPSEGTAAVPFAPTNEKDTPGSATTNSYQSITFQQPYQKYSFEELRLADYNAGRRFGTGTGQTGGFGTSTFGGFGGNTSGGFGSNNNTPASNPFGSTSTSTGFGSNTGTTGFGGGGLFGNKPASGGLFGQQSSGTTSGGLFGTTNNANTTNPFGGGAASTTTNAFGSTTGGSLFGNNQQTQAKPSLFGNTNTTNNASPGFSFGNTAASTGGTTGGLFGNTNTQQSSGGLFGNTNNQQQNKPLFGNTTGGFGAAAQPAQTTGGLFGNTNANTNTGGGLFGNTQSQNSNPGGSLFGNNASTTSGGLFGNTNTNTANKPGGLFGGSTFSNNTNQNNSGGLFGNTNTASTQQNTGGLFGNTSTNTGGFSFGGNTAPKPTTSLFGNANTSQSGGLFSGNTSSGLLGGSQSMMQQSQQQQDGVKHASLLDPNPYGQSSIWTGLPVPTPENAKPLITPLTATQKLKESQSKPPSLRLNQSRYMTPPRKQGFGFSYSTYGTPSSAASTPGSVGYSNSMYSNRAFTGGSFGRALGKSASVSNLRSQYGDGESVFTPGAFTPGVSRYSSGSIRRLTIDRSIRPDLFSRPSLPALTAPNSSNNSVSNGASNGAPTPKPAAAEPPSEAGGKLKKRVSFDKGTAGGQTNGELNSQSGALVRTENDDDNAMSDSNENQNQRGRAVNGTSNTHDQPRGNELAVVPEDRESEHVQSKPRNTTDVHAKHDPKPGDYWMKPTRAEMSKMPRDKLQKFVGFEVGRQGCGKVTFNNPVDLSALPLDDLYEKIVEIRLRSVTVYPDASLKPPVGKGLNVPSTISIENSWPRARNQPSSATSGPVFEKHVNRLKKMHGTEFVNYEISTGVWTFKVPHYTRYGLDYDEDDDFTQSQMSLPPDTAETLKSADMSVMEVDSDSYDDSADDDTFAFKQKIIPGGFGRQSAVDMEPDDSIVRSVEQDDQPSEQSEMSDEGDASDQEVSMAGSFPAPNAPTNAFESPNKPILKSTRPGTPGKSLLDLEGDWAEQLQRTISPRKQNRELLRDVQNKVLLDRVYEPMKPKAAMQKDFRTSIDIMNSLFSKHEEKRTRGGKGQAQPDFEFPYAKRAKIFDESAQTLTSEDKAWHTSFKPYFTTTNQLVCKSRGPTRDDNDWSSKAITENETRVIAKLTLKSSSQDLNLPKMLENAHIKSVKGIPTINYIPSAFSGTKDAISSTATSQELEIYELLHVLFDDYDDEFNFGLTPDQKHDFEHRIRKDRFSKFLSKLNWQRNADHIQAAELKGAATAAVYHLTTKNVHAACDALMTERNVNLTTLVAQIEQADEHFQQDIADQISAWKEQNLISDMTEEIRTLYELLSGNTTIAQGKPNGVVEDRATTFTISEKFDLDWLQAFGLCLWYGTVKNGKIEDVVADFASKLESGHESASPVQSDDAEDPLWVILKLYASSKSAEVDSPVLPQALSALSHPWNSASAFRLYHSLTTNLKDERNLKIDQEEADKLAVDLAFQLSARKDVIGATYALLHLSNPSKRAEMVQDLLLRHAAHLPSPISATTDSSTGSNQVQSSEWDALTTTLKISPTWLYKAHALYFHSTHNFTSELESLILAGEWSAAHTCLLRCVAPKLVIDEDWTGLRDVISLFGADSYAAAQSNKVGHAWDEAGGGGVYADLLDIVAPTIPSAGNTPDVKGPQEKKATLQRMQRNLARLATRIQTKTTTAQKPNDASQQRTERHNTTTVKEGTLELQERVAVKEMARLVAVILDDEGDDSITNKKAILDLPITADMRQTVGRSMAVEYYRGVMATAR